MPLDLPELPVLSPDERSCLARYVDRWLFGSVARGEAWPGGMPIRSDLDLLVVSRESLPGAEVQRLVEETMPLFLECGRQIGPQFRTQAQLAEGASATFLEEVWRGGIRLWP